MRVGPKGGASCLGLRVQGVRVVLYYGVDRNQSEWICRVCSFMYRTLQFYGVLLAWILDFFKFPHQFRYEVVDCVGGRYTAAFIVARSIVYGASGIVSESYYRGMFQWMRT
jgi:hypothetical protein